MEKTTNFDINMEDLKKLTPQQLAQYVWEMSVDFSRASEVYAGYIRKQAEFFIQERPNHKSDTATTKAWDVTPDGIDMAVTKMKIKSLEKKMSAGKAYLNVLNAEARNQM